MPHPARPLLLLRELFDTGPHRDLTLKCGVKIPGVSPAGTELICALNSIGPFSQHPFISGKKVDSDHSTYWQFLHLNARGLRLISEWPTIGSRVGYSMSPKSYWASHAVPLLRRLDQGKSFQHSVPRGSLAWGTTAPRYLPDFSTRALLRVLIDDGLVNAAYRDHMSYWFDDVQISPIGSRALAAFR